MSPRLLQYHHDLPTNFVSKTTTRMRVEDIRSLIGRLQDTGVTMCIMGELALNYYNIPCVIHIHFSFCRFWTSNAYGFIPFTAILRSWAVCAYKPFSGSGSSFRFWETFSEARRRNRVWPFYRIQAKLPSIPLLSRAKLLRVIFLWPIPPPRAFAGKHHYLSGTWAQTRIQSWDSQHRFIYRNCYLAPASVCPILYHFVPHIH